MISVIIPTYNRKNRLKKSIASVLNQSFTKIEILVVDGSNNDDTKNLVFELQDSRVLYIKNPNHTGVCSSRYFGLKKSKYGLVAFLDDDDIWDSSKLKLQYAAMLKNPSADFVLCDYIINNLKTKSKKYVSLNKYEKNLSHILSSPRPFLQCCLIKKKYINNSVLFDQKAFPSEDWDFFIQLSRKKLKAINIPKPLFIWNLSKDSQSLDLKNESNAISYIIKKHKKYLLDKTSFKNICLLYRKEAHLLIRSNAFGLAKKKYFDSLKANFLDLKSLFFFIGCLCGGSWLIKIYLEHNEQ